MIIISSNSWHYRLMAALGLEARNSGNICTYTRGLLLWSPLCLLALVFVALGLLTGAVLLPWGFGDFIGWAAACLIEWDWIEPHDGPWAAGLLVFIFVLGGSIAYFGSKGVRVASSIEVPLLGAAWDSIHGRICARVQIK